MRYLAHKNALLDKLWGVVEKPEKIRYPHRRMRAAAALAKYDPESAWAKVQEAVADDLVNVPAVYLGCVDGGVGDVKDGSFLFGGVSKYQISGDVGRHSWQQTFSPTTLPIIHNYWPI